jgi:hypothetical protein
LTVTSGKSKVGVRVMVGVGVIVAVWEGVGVSVMVGVKLAVGVGVSVGLGDGVVEGLIVLDGVGVKGAKKACSPPHPVRITMIRRKTLKNFAFIDLIVSEHAAIGYPDLGHGSGGFLALAPGI